jgi:hypothetical protein
MFLFLIKALLFVVLMSTALFAFESGDLILQGQLAYAKPCAPTFVTDYWSSSVNFGGGFGVALQRGFVLFTYTNQALTRRDGLVAENENGFAHEMLINLKRFFEKKNSKFTPYFQLSGGITLLRTPLLYKESNYIPGDIESQELLETAHAVDALAVGAGVGVTVELSELSMLYVELYGSTTIFTQSFYPNLRARAGVLFQLGD